MYIVATIFIVIAAILLTLFVLVQNSKGGGLVSGFSSSNQIMGVRKTTDFLEKMTWGLAISIVLLSVIATGYIEKQALQKDTPVEDAAAAQQQDATKTAMPGFGENAKQGQAPQGQPQQAQPAKPQPAKPAK
jgi:preprotein translocase subunit SecG